MKPFSRRILRARLAEAGPGGGGGSGAIITGVIAMMTAGVAVWLWHRLGPWGGFLGLTAAFGVVFSLWLTGRSGLRDLARQRTGESICQFARSFDRRATDPLIIRAVYERTGAWMGIPGFPLRAEDDYFQSLKFDGLDLEDLAAEVADLTRRPLADRERNPYFGKVQTPAGLVRLFMLQPPAVA